MSKKLKISNQVEVRIPDPEVWKDFKEFVKFKHETNYGVTGSELQKALKYHMAMEGWKNYPNMIHEGMLVEKSHAHSHKIGMADRILIQTIYKEVSPGAIIHFKQLGRWLAGECGLTDRRTHKSHIEVLVYNKVLEDLYNDYTEYKVLIPEEED